MRETRQLLTAAIALLMGVAAQAQTLNVATGAVTYAYDAAQTGQMSYTGGTALTVCGKSYQIDSIDKISVSDDAVEPNSVSVTWAETPQIRVSGDLAAALQISVEGGDVSIIAPASVADEITYTLSGSSSDGSFYMDGETKATLVLHNLTLTNPDGACITIDNGKRIAVEVVGDNTLVDGQGDQKACFFVNGHVELGGEGSLSLTGNAKHAYCSDEYTEVESSFGSLTVVSAKSDGLHVSQYFEQKGGTISVSCEGDGLDVGMKTKECEHNGHVILTAGSLDISSTGAASKGIKAESDITIGGADVAVRCSGDAYYDTSETDISSASGIKTDSVLTVTGGTVSVVATGTGAKGLNAAGDVIISGGSVEVVTIGAVFEYGSDDTKPHGIKADGTVRLSGGDLRVFASPDKGRAVKTDASFVVGGGTLVAAGGKATEVTVSDGVTTQSYTGMTLMAGAKVTVGGVTFTVPTSYDNSNAYVSLAGF